MMGVGDLSPSDDDDDAELREADTVRQTRSSSCASQQQTTDGAGPSTTAPAKRTHLRFVSSRRRGGHDAERQSPVRETVPDHLERRFTDVISAVEALQEEVRSSDRERKESDSVRDEQHKELGLGRQRDSAETSHEDTAALPRKDSIPPP
ncbi:hypothetical protein Q3G72_003181 [Acer saccharum]|nr:hypothetical protein Q3G72_003181 [Acer saccharum]